MQGILEKWTKGETIVASKITEEEQIVVSRRDDADKDNGNIYSLYRSFPIGAENKWEISADLQSVDQETLIKHLLEKIAI